MSTNNIPAALQQELNVLLHAAISEGKTFEEVRELYLELKILYEPQLAIQTEKHLRSPVQQQ